MFYSTGRAVHPRQQTLNTYWWGKSKDRANLNPALASPTCVTLVKVF